MKLFRTTSVLYVYYFIIECLTLPPVIFIPGDGGSQLEARLNKTSVVHYICEKTTKDYFNIWLNMELLVPLVIDCWIDNIKLVYDNATRKTYNSPGVDVRVPGFGTSETVEWLDPSHASTGSYFSSIANVLVNMGYNRTLNIKGAPYDFRKAPNENGEYFVQLKQLVEQTYSENNNESIIFIVHSMGGPMCLHFLSQQSQSWKDKYINFVISLSGAWSGSVKAMKVYAIGDDLGSYVLRESVMRQEQITNPSLAWLLPSPYFWKQNETLVQTDKKNYSLSNLQEYFNDIQLPTAWEMKKDIDPYVTFTSPGVEIHCLYGTDVDTVERLYYKPGTWLDGYPTLIYGDGDGTVNRRSLETCLHWSKMQKQKVYYKPMPKVDHMDMLRNQLVLSYVQSVIKSKMFKDT